MTNECMSAIQQLLLNRFVVVHLPVEGDAPLFVPHRLFAGFRQIDDRQPTMPQSYLAGVTLEKLVAESIRTTMFQRLGTLLEELLGRLALEVDKSGYSAHAGKGKCGCEPLRRERQGIDEIALNAHFPRH